MRQKYVLDTSALVTDPKCYQSFHNSDVVIPIAVLNELDKLKKGLGESAKNARVAIKYLDEVSKLGDVSSGIILDNNIDLTIDVSNLDKEQLSKLGDPCYGDTQILGCALGVAQNYKAKVTLVSNDINLRVRAKSYGLNAQGHESGVTNFNELYQGVQTIVDENLGLKLAGSGSIDPNLYGLVLNPHECVIFKDENGNTVSMGRKVTDNKLKLVKHHTPFGLSAKNDEQSLALDVLMDGGIDLVSLSGQAGTGKTICALAAALELVLQRKKYEKIIVYRPIQTMGNHGIGYLPGTMEEKLMPWYQAILDGMENLFGSDDNSSRGRDNWKRTLELYMKRGVIEFGAMEYVRGRSISNAIIIIDEMQNLSPADSLALTSRAATNCKYFLTGDIYQLDRSDLDSLNNGLTHVAEKFKHLEFTAHITMTKGERSRLANAAAELL